MRCADPSGQRAVCRGVARRRAILFFRPIGASSADQTSITAGSTPFSRAISAMGRWEAFFKCSIAPSASA